MGYSLTEEHNISIQPIRWTIDPKQALQVISVPHVNLSFQSNGQLLSLVSKSPAQIDAEGQDKHTAIPPG